ncbi:MAG: hypothetical protein ACTTJC_08495 [Campylobacter sp.]
MRKITIILVLLVCLFSALFWLFFGSKQPKFEEFLEIKTDLAPLECDMNKEHSCYVNFKNEKVEFSLYPKPIYTMEQITLKINGLDKFGLKKPRVEISGINMDMGVIKADLEQNGDQYYANLVLSVCVVSIMRYRFKIYDGNKDTGLFIDFDLHQ